MNKAKKVTAIEEDGNCPCTLRVIVNHDLSATVHLTVEYSTQDLTDILVESLEDKFIRNLKDTIREIRLAKKDPKVAQQRKEEFRKLNPEDEPLEHFNKVDRHG